MAKKENEKTYYIVNPKGAVHGVTREHARLRLRQAGYRPATRGEVEELMRRGGHQVFDNPIAKPFKPEPEAFEDLPAGGFVETGKSAKVITPPAPAKTDAPPADGPKDETKTGGE